MEFSTRRYKMIYAVATQAVTATSETSYTVPANTYKLTMKPRANNVKVRTTASGVFFTIASGSSLTVGYDRDLPGKSFILMGGGTDTVEFFLEKRNL